MDKVKSMIIINIVLTVIIAIGLIVVGLIAVGGSKESSTEEFDSGQISLTEQDIDTVKFSEPLLCNVSSLENGKQYTLRMNLTVVLNNKHDDYESINTFLEDTEKIDLIISDIVDIVREKNYEEIKRNDSKQILEKDFLELLQREFNSDCIIRVELPGYFYD